MCSARVTTDSPPTCDERQAGQPVVVGGHVRAGATWPRAEAATAACVSTTPFGSPLDPLVAIDERIARLDRDRIGKCGLAVGSDDGGGTHAGEQRQPEPT